MAARTAFVVACALSACTVMPGRSYQGASPTLSASEATVRDRLRAHVFALAHDIGERHAARPEALREAQLYIEKQFRVAGYEPATLAYQFAGQRFANIEATLPGRTPLGAIVVGAHYDTVTGLASDTAERLDYERMTLLMRGLTEMVAALAASK